MSDTHAEVSDTDAEVSDMETAFSVHAPRHTDPSHAPIEAYLQ
jgi:hypothetical protein